MKIINLVLSITFLLFVGQGVNAQKQRVIRDVVLLNKEPFEVLMSEKGDILYKVKHLPDYLKSKEEIDKVMTDGNELASNFPEEAAQSSSDVIAESNAVPQTLENTSQTTMDEKEVVEEKVQDQKESITPSPPARITKAKRENVNFREYYEIEFLPGTATLNNKSISTLNELAAFLNNNPENHMQVFGFQNESPIVALLLSQRRRDACIAYLKIKGVKVARQVSRGSITKGANNKIVFGLE